jgi:hypothetical protein
VPEKVELDVREHRAALSSAIESMTASLAEIIADRAVTAQRKPSASKNSRRCATLRSATRPSRAVRYAAGRLACGPARPARSRARGRL